MSLAIAYGMKKKAKMAKGGKVKYLAEGGETETSTTGNKTKTGGSNPGGASTGGAGTVTITTGKNPPSIDVHDVGGRTDSRNAGGMDPGDVDDRMLAKGGSVCRGVGCPGCERCMYDGGEVEPSPTPTPKEVATSDFVKSFKNSFGVSSAEAEGEQKKAHGGSIEHDELMAQLKEQNDAEVDGWLKDGDKSKPDYSNDMVGDIIAKRYSKGGRVANDVGTGQEADKLPNQYDDLVLRDDLEQHYTGANSGDFLGNGQKDEDERDLVAQIMKSRRKKDRMPRLG